MNLFFLFLIGYLLQRSAETAGWRGMTLTGLAGISFYLFNWWYNHPEFLIPFLFTFVVLLRLNKGKNTPIPWVAKVLFFVFITGAFDVSLLYENMMQFLGKYFSFQAYGYDFPNITAAVGEAKQLSFWQTLSYIGNIPVSLLGMAGLAGLIISTRERFLGLVPALLIGLLAFRSANRFAMYLAPFIGMGIGFWVSHLMRVFSQWTTPAVMRRSIRPLAVLMMLITCFMGVSLGHYPVPVPEPEVYRGLRHLAQLQGPGAAWTWWDWGYAIEDIARTSTYADGGRAGKAYFVGLTLAEKDPDIAHNILSGITNIGDEGIYREIKNRNLDSAYQIVKELKEGKYNADLKIPVYVVFTRDMISKFSWINYFGTWDFQEKIGMHSGYMPLEGPVEEKDTHILAQNASINLESGHAELENGVYQIKSVRMIDYSYDESRPLFREIANYKYNGDTDLFVQIIKWKTGKLYLLLKEQIYLTLFHQMFILNAYDHNLFELVYSDYPFVKIFRVKPKGWLHQKVAEGPVPEREEDLNLESPLPRLPADFSPVLGTVMKGYYVDELDSRTRVVYTLEPQLQQEMYEWFARQRVAYGVLVAMEPRSGRVLALVEYADNIDATGMARKATYPAASVFKLVTTAAVLEKGVMSPETVTRFRGEVLELNPFHWTEDPLLDDRQMTLTEALAESCIPVVARIALKWLKPEELYQESVHFGFNEEISFELPVQVSRAPLPEDTSSLSYTAAGFGNVGLSPVHGAMIAAMIANRGVMMAPRLIEQVVRDDEVIYTLQPQEMGQRMDAETAGQLRDMMSHTVLNGTARDAFRLWRRHPVLKKISVSGKTGTLDGADPPGEYSWFIGMASMKNAQIAMAAMVIRQPFDRVVKAYDAAQHALKKYFIGSLHSGIKTAERSEHDIPVMVNNEH
jgi:hypothetical protein